MDIQQSTLQSWLYGNLGTDPLLFHKNSHKITYYAQIIPQKSLYVLIFGSFISYFILVVCGSLGAPDPIKYYKVDCGVQNNCTLASKEEFDVTQYSKWRQIFQSQPIIADQRALSVVEDELQFQNGHLQICQQNNRKEMVTQDTTTELGIKTYYDEKQGEVEFNYSVGIYESNNLKFYDLCNRYNYLAKGNIEEKDDYGRKIEVNTVMYSDFATQKLQCQKSVAETQFLKKLESKPTEKQQKMNLNFEEFQEKYEEQFNSSIYSCQREITQLNKFSEKTFRMIVIDFDSKSFSNLMNIQVIERQPNFVIFEYKKIMSFIFFLVSGLSVILFGSKIYQLSYEEIGFLKRLVYANLLSLLFYNLFYSFSSKDHWFNSFLDDFINALMMSLLLFLNLVLIDSQTDKIKKSGDVKNFIQPKAIICFAIFITLHFFMYTHSVRLHKYITEMNQIENSIDTASLFGQMDITDALCSVIFSIYGFISIRYTIVAFSQANKKYHQNKSTQNYNLYNLIFANTEIDFLKEDLTVSRFTPVLVCLISMILLGLLFMPPRDEMLQFMDESGLINVYLIVLSFMVSPVQEIDVIRFEGQREAIKQQCKLYQNQLKAQSKSNAQTMKTENQKVMDKINQKMEDKIRSRKRVQEYEEMNDTDTESVPVIQNSQVDLMDIINVHSEGMEMQTIENVRKQQQLESEEEDEDQEDLDATPIDIFEVGSQIEDNGLDVKVTQN